MRLVVANTCTCDLPVDVLLMHEAVPVVAVKGLTDKDVQAFMELVVEVCERELDFTWDAVTRNVAVYGDRLVALDFGDPEREDW